MKIILGETALSGADFFEILFALITNEKAIKLPEVDNFYKCVVEAKETTVDLETDLNKKDEKQELNVEQSISEQMNPKLKVKLTEPDPRVLDLSIDDCCFSIRAIGRLKSLGIKTVRELISHTPEQLLSSKQIYPKLLISIEEELRSEGLSLKKESIDAKTE